MPENPAPTAETPVTKVGLLRSVWTTGVWKFLPFVLINIIGVATLYPCVPMIITNGFASAAAGHPIDCEEFTPETSPKECREAHAQAVTWGSWTSFLSGCILSSLFSPVSGHLSDHWGRKPFIIVGICLSLCAPATIWMHLKGWLSIYWYYPASALGGLVSAFTMVLTAVGDIMSPEHCAASVAFITATFSIGLIIGPNIGACMDSQAAVATCIGLTLVALLYVLLCVPESAPRRRGAPVGLTANSCCRNESAWDAQSSEVVPDGQKAAACDVVSPVDGSYACAQAECQPADLEAVLSAAAAESVRDSTSGSAVQPALQHGSRRNSSSMGQDLQIVCSADSNEDTNNRHTSEHRQAAGSSLTQLCGFSSGWVVLLNSSWYFKLAIIWALVNAMSSGVQDVLYQYLQLQLGFTTPDQAHLLVVAACCSLSVKVVLLGLLSHCLGDQWLLALGLAAYVAEYLLLAAAATKLTALVAVGVGSIAAVCWPAMIALQSSRADPEEWGAVAGVLQAVGSLATGLGPVVFAALFSEFSTAEDQESKLYLPQVVWYVAAAMGTMATLLTATLHWETPVKDKGCHTNAAAHESASVKKLQEDGGDMDVGSSTRDRSCRHSLGSLGSLFKKCDAIAATGGSSRAAAASGSKHGGQGQARDVEQPLLSHDIDCESDEDRAEQGGYKGSS